MPLDLAAPISAFFEATNRHDPEAVAGCFTADGLVHDENADHRGQAAIGGWAKNTYDKYDVTLTPREARDDGGATVVTAGVAGTFPGSPIELPFRFTLAGEKIADLVIG
jgi:hypothetical protein